jgi:uncharacterized protein YecT (DUF1311 family)
LKHLIVLLLLAALPARAEDANPIDAKLEACLASPAGQSTQGMVECTAAASAAYDKRLNTVYVQALAALDPASKDKLRDAQRAWLAFRRAEEQVYAGSWRDDRGTIMRIILAQTMLSALKERVQELEAYLPESQ